MPRPTSHIAAFRLSALGDVAMTVPVIKAFVQQYPQIQLTVVSRPFFKPLFDDIPNCDFFDFHGQGRHKGLSGLLRLYADLRKRNIDAFADLHDVIRSKIVSALFKISGKKVASIDKGRDEKKALTRPHNKTFRQLKHATERYAAVFEKLGFPVDMSKPQLLRKAVLDSNIEKIVGKREGSWLGIAPLAQHEAKVYPSDLMQKVIDALSADEGVRIFLFGSRDEISSLAALAGDKKNIMVVPGKLDFSQQLNLISNLDVMLSMDSGNAHLSAIFGIPTITLWGATHPFAGFSPYLQPIENALVSDREKYPMLPTSIYGNKKIEGYKDAMRTILPQKVIAKIREAIAYTSS